MNERDLKLQKILLTEEELKDVAGGAKAGETPDYDACSKMTTKDACNEMYFCLWDDNKCVASSIEPLGGFKNSLTW